MHQDTISYFAYAIIVLAGAGAAYRSMDKEKKTIFQMQPLGIFSASVMVAAIAYCAMSKHKEEEEEPAADAAPAADDDEEQADEAAPAISGGKKGGRIKIVRFA